MAPAAQIEEQIRQLCESRRIRVQNFFDDFDKLRSGIVTRNQFVRTLWMNLGVKLTPDEEEELSQKYSAGSGRVNYKLFCDSVDATRAFDASNVTVPPSAQVPPPPELLGSRKSVRPLSPDSERQVALVLQRLAQHYRLGGHSLRPAFKEFDVHNIGCVTESQFYRALPMPKEFGEAEAALLARRYADPLRAGLVNYLNVQADLDALAAAEASDESSGVAAGANATRLPFVEAPPLDSSVQMLLQRIRVAVHRNGVRILDFLRDHDRLRHDLITENQFSKSLQLAVGKEAGLTPADCQQLANFYGDGQGRVHYRDFAIAMDSPFHEHRLEKRPTAEVVPPPQVARSLPLLSDAEEQQLQQVLVDIRKQVLERRIMLHQYFRDYDRSKAYTRVMTPQQLGRSLHFLTLDVTPEQLRLVARKFADPGSGDVNYPAFVEAVDPDFKAQAAPGCEQPTLEERAANSQQRDWNSIVERPVLTVGDCVSLEDLLVRIRSVVLSTGSRVKDFFVDFDGLRSGLITQSQFQRCLSQIGLSKLGWHDLSTRQLQTLCDHYADKDGNIRWTQFVEDVDSVFTRKNLEKDPQAEVLPSEIFVAPKPGTTTWEAASDEQQSVYNEALGRLAQKVAQRRMLVRPTFQDFDRHRRGTMSRTQFRQAMTMLGLSCEQHELEAIEARFAVDEGFNYSAFLDDLEPQQAVEFMYDKRLQELRQVQARSRLPDANPATDADQVLWRIRTKVVRERLRVHEFLKDFDRLRSGRINKVTFRRALSTSGLGLCESEFSHLENLYESRKDPDSVEWMRFVDDVEAAFTQKHLEKTPLLEPEPFVPEPESKVNVLPDAVEQQVADILAAIADQVRQRRTLVLPFFESYDRVHHGTVSQNQFRRVLTDLGIVDSLSTEQWAMLFAKFRQRVGTRDDVNYLHFVDAVHVMAGFDPRKP